MAPPLRGGKTGELVSKVDIVLRLVKVDGRSGDPRLDADVLRARPRHEYMHDMHEGNALERGK